MRMFAEGATGLSLPVLENREASWRKMCFVFLLRFIYLFFYIMMNCTVFWENEIVHVKKKTVENTIWEAAGAS